MLHGAGLTSMFLQQNPIIFKWTNMHILCSCHINEIVSTILFTRTKFMLSNKTYYHFYLLLAIWKTPFVLNINVNVHATVGAMKRFIYQLFVLTNAPLLCSHAVLVYSKWLGYADVSLQWNFINWHCERWKCHSFFSYLWKYNCQMSATINGSQKTKISSRCKILGLINYEIHNSSE